MKSTRPLAIALLSIVPFTAVSTAQAAPATGPSVQQAASVARPADASSEGAGYADTILQDVNDLRTQLGLQPVTRYTQLDSVAQTWSEQMASQDTMSHNPSFADQFPGGWSAASENVAMRTGSGSTDIGSQLFDQWKESPGHYANMTATDVNSIGIGIAYNSSTDSWYATQNFADYSDPASTGLAPTGQSSSSNNDAEQPTPEASPQTPAGSNDAGSSTPVTTGAPEGAADAPSTTDAPATATEAAPSKSADDPASSPVASAASSDDPTGTAVVARATASSADPTVVAAKAPAKPTLPVTGASLAAGLVAIVAVGDGVVLLRLRRRAR